MKNEIISPEKKELFLKIKKKANIKHSQLNQCHFCKIREDEICFLGLLLDEADEHLINFFKCINDYNELLLSNRDKVLEIQLKIEGFLENNPDIKNSKIFSDLKFILHELLKLHKVRDNFHTKRS